MAEIPLVVRQSFEKAYPDIETSIGEISKSLGKDLTFVDNKLQVYDHLNKHLDPKFKDKHLPKTGEQLLKYVQAAEKTLGEFLENAANKEQLEKELTTGNIGLRFDETVKYTRWNLVDGTLWIEITAKVFSGNQISWRAPKIMCDELSSLLGKSEPIPLSVKKKFSSKSRRNSSVTPKHEQGGWKGYFSCRQLPIYV